MDVPAADGPAAGTTPAPDPAPSPGFVSTPAPVAGSGSRVRRAKMPRARQVAVDAAIEAGVCIRPHALRRTDLTTGETTIVDTPCGSTLASVCPPCADRARRLRAQQCRDGWHLAHDLDLTPAPSTRTQRDLTVERAQITAELHAAEQAGDQLLAAALAESLAEVDQAIADAGVRGRLDPGRSAGRRARSTRRRQDTPDLPVRPSNGSTLGRVFTDPKNGRAFRPSLFVTLTLPSYGRIRAEEGTPADPSTYDYPRAARDALHFAKLLDRFTQNLRRVAGYDLQYFAAIEPQRRLAPHAHFAIRGTLPRATVRQVVAATYHQVWWPPTEHVVYDGDRHPVWDPDTGHEGGFVDPDTRIPLPTWDQALDAIGPDDEPQHLIRPGTQIDIQGVLAGTPQADQCIGYLVKYLTKSLGDNLTTTPTGNDHDQDRDRDEDHDQGSEQGDDAGRAARWAAHRDRLADALRHEPCSPTCPNWLRYGVQPKNPKPHARPGACRGKAHKPTHLGHAGRRVLVSRKWTGKTLTDHRADRRNHVHQVLGLPDPLTTNPHSGTGTRPVIAWENARPTDPDVPPLSRRLLLAIAQRHRWRTEYRAARDHPPGTAPPTGPPELPATTPDPAAHPAA